MNKYFKIRYLLVLVGAILAFFVREGYAISCYIKDNSVSIKELFDDYGKYSLNAAAIISPILGILGAGAILASQFIEE